MSQKSHAIYVVQQGDNLSNIVKKIFKLTSPAAIAKKVREVVSLNRHITNPNLIRPGEVTFIKASVQTQVSLCPAKPKS